MSPFQTPQRHLRPVLGTVVVTVQILLVAGLLFFTYDSLVRGPDGIVLTVAA